MKQIKLLTWPDYVSPKTLIDFENEYQVRVQLEIVPSAIELMERMRASARSIDVLVPPDYAVRELAGAGRLLGLDHARPAIPREARRPGTGPDLIGGVQL